jgi:preprotein translocase subunit SecA
VVKGLFKIFGGDANERAVRKLQSLVDEINALESRFSSLSDEELRNVTTDFRTRHEKGEALDDLLPEAFAAVREAAKRTLDMRHFDVQLIGGAVLHQGKIAEMRTGEGKTLVATLPTYLNALTGRGVHVVTVNDYLARRDATWMGPVYAALGVTVGCLQHDASLLFDPSAPEDERMRPVHRKEAYAADITYGTNSEFGFDYLRDNMALALDHRVQRELAYAIVDEVDYILIDEARTPLIISGPSQEPAQSYQRFAQLAKRLVREEDYLVDEKTRAVTLTEEGIDKVERALEIDNLYAPEHYTLVHFMENALKAEVVFHRDKEYVVTADSQVVIVDEFTGRLMPGRRYSDGLHQAIEAKEGVPVQRESVTLATVTLQNYFRMYEKLAGMTGTASTESEEFFKIYRLEPVTIPTNRPMVRDDFEDLIYLTEAGKFRAIVKQVEELHARGRPILIGTAAIETSERLSAYLKEKGMPHEVLNAKQHEREAAIVAQAGRVGAVTVATNMAGRGTDIILGGSTAGRDPEDWRREHDRVVEMGGLYILGTERHEARRIDNQLRGRAGRQGDPGASQFYVSLEDEIIRRFGGDRVKAIMSWAGLDEDTPIQQRMVAKAFENAQTRVEGYNFEIRKHLVEYDDVVNRQREVVYAERTKALRSEDLKDDILAMIDSEVRNLVQSTLTGRDRLDWDVESFLTGLKLLMPMPEWAESDALQNMGTREEVEEALLDHAYGLYEEKEKLLGPERMRQLERLVVLQMIDTLWVQHLTALENMRLGIGLQAYGQRDPLVMFRQEGHAMFQELLERLRNDIARTILHVTVRVQPVAPPAQQQQAPVQQQQGQQPQVIHTHQGQPAPQPRQQAPRPAVPAAAAAIPSELRASPMASQQRNAQGQAPDAAGASAPARRNTAKIGRNDPCWCGSGLKFKKCHGQAA